MNKSELTQDISGCLDYCLRHSSWFSGYNDGTVKFTSDDGWSCEVRVDFSISNIQPPEENAEIPECTLEEYKLIKERYKNGDTDVYPADDPKNLRVGFIVKESEKVYKSYSLRFLKVKDLLAAGGER